MRSRRSGRLIAVLAWFSVALSALPLRAEVSREDAKLEEAISVLKALIAKSPVELRAELIHRLAEMYWEQSKRSPGGASAAARRAALRLYERVLTEYPDYPRNDEVLLQLGLAQGEA